MSNSFHEFYHGKTGLTVGVEEILCKETTEYQTIEVFRTDTWGNMMVIDGLVMFSERDEFVYHELLSHVALFTHPNPERVLIIGGGDGGTAREVLRHASVERVDLVEIDERVIWASKQYFPTLGDWDDPRLHIKIEDGTHYINKVKQPYDVIIIDGSDPAGPATGLFEPEFIKACYDALNDHGVLNVQSESPWIESYHQVIRSLNRSLKSHFDYVKLYLGYIPLYPAGMWSFIIGSKQADPLGDETINRVKHGIDAISGSLEYYNREIHIGAFSIPQFVIRILEED